MKWYHILLVTLFATFICLLPLIILAIVVWLDVR